MNRRSRNFCVIFLCMLFACVCSGCKEKPPKDVKVDKIINSMGEQIARDSELNNYKELNWQKIDLKKEEGKEILKSMELEPSRIKEGIYFLNPVNVKADCILVAKAEDKESISEIKNALTKFKKSQEENWKNYLPEQYEKVKNAVIAVKEDYVMYLVYEDTAQLTSIAAKLLE